MRTARASRGSSPEDGAGGTGIPAAIPRRLVLPACGAALFLVPGAGSPAAPSEAAGWKALRAGGAVVLFRHATAPGTGDPSGMRLGDCSTQRNLDAAGRALAARIGEAIRARGVAVGAVLASRWCRAAETADLAFPGRARAEPAFDSFFAERGEGPARTAEARRVQGQRTRNYRLSKPKSVKTKNRHRRSEDHASSSQNALLEEG